MKKIALVLILSFAATATFAGGCWVSGKYKQCVKSVETTSQEDAR